jgi:predicted Zn-dependent protease
MMSRLRACGTALFCGLLLVGCGDIGAPNRSNLYEFRNVVSVGDTLSFHWPTETMPVTFWVEDSLNLRAHTDSAIAVWQRELLYNEFRGEIVTDSASADVIVRAETPPGNAVPAMVDACQAATDLPIDPMTHVLTLPVRVYVEPRFDPSSPGTQACFATVMIHELGHVLGILNHSSNPLDIMFSNPTVATPSERDRNTVQVMYHWPMNVTITR